MAKKAATNERSAQDILEEQYLKVKTECTVDPKSTAAGEAINLFARTALEFLVSTCKQAPLVSKVNNKKYFSFERQGVLSRPINEKYFILDMKKFDLLWKKWLKGDLTDAEFETLSYTVTLAPCAAMELFDRQNKKGPATYFECYIGYVFSRAMQENPTRKVKFPIADREVLMTMDFLFNFSNGKNVHVPVKMSTRERVVQAWAHQRLLNAAYGENKYTGVMVLFSETKLNSRTREVVEICVPDQWLIYQSLLARMARIYYFDPPERYLELTRNYPDLIQIKKFGEFFSEMDKVLPKTPGL